MMWRRRAAAGLRMVAEEWKVEEVDVCDAAVDMLGECLVRMLVASKKPMILTIQQLRHSDVPGEDVPRDAEHHNP